MTTAPRVLLFDAADGRAGELGDRLRRRGLLPLVLDAVEASRPGTWPNTDDVAVVLVNADEALQRNGSLAALLKRLAAEKVATVIHGGGADPRREGGPLIEWLAADVSLDEVVGKVGTLAHYVPLLKGFERELRQLERLGEQLNRYFSEIDQEMRLAGRLQRDFLPRELPRGGPFRFEALYRPASWVSGDMYDVFRIDADHLGVFVADAMGHGVAAGLLTMFLRQALVASRATGGSDTAVAPAEALENLHACLIRQELPNSQFVTAAYGVVDIRRRELNLARAGHPYPLHIRRDGSISEVRASGSLLGLEGVPTDFEATCVPLAAGDKVVFYTDGLEGVLATLDRENADAAKFTNQFQQWARLHATDLVRAVGDHLDCRAGSLHPADDVTMLVLEAAD